MSAKTDSTETPHDQPSSPPQPQNPAHESITPTGPSSYTSTAKKGVYLPLTQLISSQNSCLLCSSQILSDDEATVHLCDAHEGRSPWTSLVTDTEEGPLPKTKAKPSASSARLFTYASLLGSLITGVFLVTAYVIWDSQMALAQAMDSIMDLATGVILLSSVKVSRKSPDHDHQFGHARAEPMAGFVMAIVAGILGFEVVRSALTSILENEPGTVELPLLFSFLFKLVFKTLMFTGTSLSLQKTPNSTSLTALRLDARNDIAVSTLAVISYFGSAGYPLLDAYLALPLGPWIMYGAYGLAQENIPSLMGGAPSAEREAELTQIAHSVPGILGAHGLRAQFIGNGVLQVHVHLVVSPDLFVKEAHDLGEAVRVKLLGEDDVIEASTHLDID